MSEEPNYKVSYDSDESISLDEKSLTEESPPHPQPHPTEGGKLVKMLQLVRSNGGLEEDSEDESEKKKKKKRKKEKKMEKANAKAKEMMKPSDDNDDDVNDAPQIVFGNSKKKPVAKKLDVFHLKTSLFGNPVSPEGSKIHLRALVVNEKVFVSCNDLFKYFGFPLETKKCTRKKFDFVRSLTFDATPKKVVPIEKCIFLAECLAMDRKSVAKDRIAAFKKAIEVLETSGAVHIVEERAAEDIPPPPDRSAKKTRSGSRKKASASFLSESQYHDSSSSYESSSSEEDSSSEDSDDMQIERSKKSKKSSKKSSSKKHTNHSHSHSHSHSNSRPHYVIKLSKKEYVGFRNALGEISKFIDKKRKVEK